MPILVVILARVIPIARLLVCPCCGPGGLAAEQPPPAAAPPPVVTVAHVVAVARLQRAQHCEVMMVVVASIRSKVVGAVPR